MLVLFMGDAQIGLRVLVLLVLADDGTRSIAKMAHATTVADCRAWMSIGSPPARAENQEARAAPGRSISGVGSGRRLRQRRAISRQFLPLGSGRKVKAIQRTLGCCEDAPSRP